MLFTVGFGGRFFSRAVSVNWDCENGPPSLIVDTGVHCRCDDVEFALEWLLRSVGCVFIDYRLSGGQCQLLRS